MFALSDEECERNATELSKYFCYTINSLKYQNKLHLSTGIRRSEFKALEIVRDVFSKTIPSNQSFVVLFFCKNHPLKKSIVHVLTKDDGWCFFNSLGSWDFEAFEVIKEQQYFFQFHDTFTSFEPTETERIFQIEAGEYKAKVNKLKPFIELLLKLRENLLTAGENQWRFDFPLYRNYLEDFLAKKKAFDLDALTEDIDLLKSLPAFKELLHPLVQLHHAFVVANRELIPFEMICERSGFFSVADALFAYPAFAAKYGKTALFLNDLDDPYLDNGSWYVFETDGSLKKIQIVDLKVPFKKSSVTPSSSTSSASSSSRSSTLPFSSPFSSLSSSSPPSSSPPPPSLPTPPPPPPPTVLPHPPPPCPPCPSLPGAPADTLFLASFEGGHVSKVMPYVVVPSAQLEAVSVCVYRGEAETLWQGQSQQGRRLAQGLPEREKEKPRGEERNSPAGIKPSACEDGRPPSELPLSLSHGPWAGVENDNVSKIANFLLKKAVWTIFVRDCDDAESVVFFGPRSE